MCLINFLTYAGSMRSGNNGSGQGDYSGQGGRPPTPPVGRGGLPRGAMTRGQPSNNGMMGNYANDMRGRNRRGR